MSEKISETLREITPSLGDGHYSIISTLKEGRLYLADKAGKRFVLKTANDAKGLEMLKREYELSIGLSHPGLAYIFTWEEDSPVGPCIVQEYIDAIPLGQWLSEKPSLKERRRIFGELLSVVGYLHRKGVIHNDLKPDNILISRADNTLKIIDLGFADDNTHIIHSLGGTPGYASPELIAGEKTDARSDIYSIGILMKDLFPGRYGHLARKCCRPAPEDRYQNVAELESAWQRQGWPIVIIPALLIVLGAIALFQSREPLTDAPAPAKVDTVIIVKVDTIYSVSPAPSTARSHSSAHTSSDARIIDSLTSILNERDRKDAEDKAALEAAKAKVEAVYDRSISKFRKALSKAQTQNDAVDAWMAFLEDMKEVNYDIPAAAPESIAHILREYILQRNTVILDTLNSEFQSRLSELPQN